MLAPTPTASRVLNCPRYGPESGSSV
jgi:hypothetical protein